MKAHRIIRPILFVLVLPLLIAAQNEEIKVPDDVKPFVEKGMVVLGYKSGDLNGDGRKDAVLVLTKPRDENRVIDKDGDENRPTLILVRDVSGKLYLAARNDMVAYCRNCGGIFGDPFEWVKMHRLGFEVANMGGDSDRWIETFWFAYSPRHRAWRLTRVEESAYRAEPDPKVKTRVHTPKRFGLIKFEKFDPHKFFNR